MLDNNNIAIAGLVIYAAIMVAVGWITGRSKNHENYVIGGRNVGIFPTAISIGAGWRDIAFITFWLSTSYSLGWATFTVCIGSISSLYVLSHFAAKLRSIAAEKGYVTPAQMIRDFIGDYSRTTYSLIFLAVGLLHVSAQLFVMGSLISASVGIERIYTVPLVAMVVAFYLWRGGYGSVIITDVIQGFIIFALILLPFVVESNPADIYDWQSAGNLGWVETIALIIFPFFWNLGSPDVWQRIFSARDEKTVKIGLPLGAIFFTLLTFSVVFLGIALRQYAPNADPNNLFVMIFSESLFSPIIMALLLVTVFAMGMSTIDTWSYIFSSTLIREILRQDSVKQRDTYIRNTRLTIIAFLTISSLIALSFDNIMSVLMGIISSYAIATPMIIVVLFGLLKKSPLNDKIVSITSICGFILFGYCQATGFFGDSFLRSLLPVISVLTIILIWAGISKLTPNKKPQ